MFKVSLPESLYFVNFTSLNHAQTLDASSFPAPGLGCQGASRICGLLMINRQSGSIVCGPSLSFYSRDLIEMMTLVKQN